MTPFWSGFLGALAALVVLFAVRRIVWFAAWRRWHRGGHRRPSGHARRGLDRLFRRLGARPEQEDVLRAEAEALFAELSAFRGDTFALREDLAALLSAPALDEATVASTLERPLARLGELRTRIAGSIARVHGALDVAQRERLAELVRCGRHGRGGHGPHHATA